MSKMSYNEMMASSDRLIKKIDTHLKKAGTVKTATAKQSTQRFQPEPGSVAEGIMQNAINRAVGDQKYLNKKYKK